MARTVRLALPSVIAALTVLSGCGGGQEGKDQAPAGQAAPGASQPAAPSQAIAAGGDPTADVKITKCVRNGMTQDVTIEVTNSSDQPLRYAVGIDIKDASGKAVSEARFANNRMTPGQTITETIPGDTPINGEITCAVGEVKRLPPK